MISIFKDIDCLKVEESDTLQHDDFKIVSKQRPSSNALIIDPSLVCSKIISKQLESIGWKSVYYRSIDEALIHLEEKCFHKYYDLIICEIIEFVNARTSSKKEEIIDQLSSDIIHDRSSSATTGVTASNRYDSSSSPTSPPLTAEVAHRTACLCHTPHPV